jgi:hypothetical protein
MRHFKFAKSIPPQRKPMNPQDQRRIIQWCATLDRTCTIQFYTTEDSRSRLLQQFCDALQALAPQIRVVKDEPLCGGFDGLAETVQGDVLQVLATAGGPSVQSFLASVCDGGYGKEVRTAAREILAEMAASRGEG